MYSQQSDPASDPSLTQTSLNSSTYLSDMGMVLQMADGTIQACNATAERLLGMTIGQMEGVTSIDYPWQTIHPDGSPFPGEMHPAMIALQTGQPSTATMGFHRPDCEIMWLSLNSQPLFRAGEATPYAVVTTFTQLPAINIEHDRYFRQASLQDLSNTLESITDAFFSLDRDWRFTYLNSQAVQVLNRGFNDLIGRNVWEAFPEAIGSLFDYEYHRAVAQEVTVSFEAFYPPLDCWFAVRAYPIASGLAVYFQNITDQKVAEASLQRQKQTAYQRLAEIDAIYATAPIGLCFVDPDLRFVRINDRLAEINGTPAEAHIGRTLREILPEMADSLEPLYHQVMQTGIPLENFEARGTNASQPGVERDWLVSLYPLKAIDDTVLGVNVVVYEITESKQAQAALSQTNSILRSVIEDSSDIIFVKDTQGRYVVVNPTAAHWLNTTVDAMLGRSDFELFPSDVAERIWQIDCQVMQTGKSVSYEEEVPRQKKLRSLLSSKYPWRDVAGKVIGVIGISRDISDRKQSEIQLQQQADELSRANRIKDEFLAVLSHELRSPLNPILGWTRLLQSRKLSDEKVTEALSAIERNARIQTQLIDDLLDIARILRGKLTLAHDPVDLGQVIEAAIETVHLSAEAKSIQIQTTIAPEVGLVIGDASRLQQVVWNLLSNAVKFTPSGGQVQVRLQSSALNAQAGNSVAQIHVTDTGKGIHADFLPCVFEAFRQADSTITRQYGGLGLGLSIVKQIVELHGGTVRATSPGEGKGATFTVQLPIHHQTVTDTAMLTPAAQTLDLNGVQVLIVDDEPDSREFIQFVLELHGAKVTAASSASQALQIFSTLNPDLLVSDIGMPHMDGYALIRQLRQSNLRTPAIALTAYAGEGNRQQAIAAGFDTHLSKPIDPEEFVRLITTLLQRRFD
ncbi:PAS domain-containing protein [Phormidesmis sp. 146-12]